MLNWPLYTPVISVAYGGWDEEVEIFKFLLNISTLFDLKEPAKITPVIKNKKSLLPHT